MSIFDLVFLLSMLGLVTSLAFAAVRALRGQGTRALTILRRLTLAIAIYFALVLAVSIGTPQHVVALGTAQCFDDWCITVSGSDRVADSLHVTLKLSNRARGITEGERDVNVAILADSGRRYDPVPASNAIPMSVQIPPNGETMVQRTFAIPATATQLRLIVTHDAFPHCCIIGDRESLLHRAAVVRVQ